jgi:NitT/TauT family transport system substrate-binding protein
MAVQLSSRFKRLVLLLVVIGGGYYALRYASSHGMIPRGKQAGGFSTTQGTGKVSNASSEPITVCVVTWPGYAGGEYFNGGFAASSDSRYYREYGIKVAFKVIEQFVPSREAWKADQCQVIWQTADAFPTEVAGLKDYHPKIVFQADWSRGGDVVIAGHGINSVNDLRGKTVSAALGTPSHTLLLRMLEAAGMTIHDIRYKPTEDAPGSAQMFKAGSVDAAVVWSPDDQDVLKSVPGSHVLTSSKVMSNMIADVFFVKQSYLETHRDELRALVEGWLRGAAEINTDPSAKEQAIQILANGLNQPLDFIRAVIDNARLVTYGDNANFFNLNGDYSGVTGQELYESTGRLYHHSDASLAPEVLPPWSSVADLGIIRSIHLTGPEQAAEPVATFAKATATDANAAPLSVKHITITFPTGSAELDENVKYIIDTQFASTAKTAGNARIRIEGNTDDVGSPDMNQALSERRAQAVVDYLVSKYGFDSRRFVVVGNGSRKPVASNDTDSGRARNRRTDFELLNN